MGESGRPRPRFQKNGFEHAVDVATNFSIREAKDGETLRF